jgi:phosphatidylserine/phosphatidylglycerophosphate/cardiolipin synthase-like enzyme
VEERQEKRPVTSVTTDPVERLILAPEERRQAVLNVIDSARDRLALSVFRCDDQPVLDSLAAAVRRGVQVRVLMTGRAKGSKIQLQHLYSFLKTVGADVRRYADAVVRYHAKFIVADDGTALIASLNFTRKCFQATCDFVVVSNDSELVQGVTRLFDADWNGTRYPVPDVPGHRLIVGPEQARRRFATLFGEATHSIRIIDPKISDPAMLMLLRARAAEGIRVDIRGADALGPLVPHGKLIMIDDASAVIGSMSLSTLALEFRRELAVVIRDRASLMGLEQFWTSLPGAPTGVATAGFSGDPPHPA